MLQTPTPPTTNRFASRATSVCSQRYPGSVKSRKSRCDDDDIPSDESDFGGKRPYPPNMRTRVRKRRAISVKPPPSQAMSTSGMSYLSLSASKITRTQSVCAPSSSFSNVTTTTQKTIKKALFPAPSSPNKSPSPTHVRPGSSNLHGIKSSSIHPNLGLKRGRTSSKSPPRTPKRIRTPMTSPTINQDPVARKTKVPAKWVLYSVWHPAWDVIWKCDNGKSPLIQNQYFRKLISEVLKGNTTLLDSSATIDLKVIKVQDIKEDSQGKLIITGDLEEEEGRHRSNRKKKKYEPPKWKPAAGLLGRLLKYVVSASDLIVQYKYPPASETGNSKEKICFIHITPKDGQPVNVFDLSEMGAHISAFNMSYDYYKPKVIKCIPLKLTRTEETTEEPVAVEAEATSAATVVDKATSKSKNLAAYVFGSPGPSPISSPVPLSGTRPNVASITDEQQDEESLDVGNEIIMEQSVAPLSEQIEAGMEIALSDDEELDVSPNPLTSGTAPCNQKNADNEFDLTRFLNRGEFVPGPLRPRVKKPDKPYVYHTLKELLENLVASIAEDEARKKEPTRMVKHQCNVYGIVVQENDQDRHENAYFVRISDETMKSVLVRIHAGVNQSPGPEIRLGNIIRIHRLTAQEEWDSLKSENRMVLSTSAHHNYVLFEQSNEQYRFYYNTCAKTVTLSNIDTKRVGELHAYKSITDISENEEAHAPLPTEQNGIAPVALDEPAGVNLVNADDNILVAPPCNSDGICGSDLASPCASETSIGEDESQSGSESLFEESGIQAASNSRSDESFFSATSDVDNDNRPPVRSRQSEDSSLQLNTTVQPKRRSQSITFTLFKDLKSTTNPLNLLCQIVSLNEQRQGMWCLILKDLEQTVPSSDFKQPQSSLANSLAFHLGVNIKNGIMLERRHLLSMLVESQGTDEFYFIPNISVKGTQPPYTLEMDGNSCEIRRFKHLSRFLEMDDTPSFCSAPSSSANPHQGQRSEIIADDDVMDEQEVEEDEQVVEEDEQVVEEDEQFQMGEIMNADGAVVTTGSNSDNPFASEEDSDDDIIILAEIPVSRNGGSSQSDFETARNTPSPSPTKIQRQGSHMQVGTHVATIPLRNLAPDEDVDPPVEESWTGRLRGRRKPRQHYQPEDSFEC